MFYNKLMDFNNNSIDRLAKITNLRLTAAEKKSLTQELVKITAWIEKLQQVDTKDTPLQTTMSVEVNTFAKHIPQPPLPLEKVFLNAPKHDGAYFHVPKLGLGDDKN